MERYNDIIGKSVSTVENAVKCPLEVASDWSLFAKNLIQNIHGFSFNQLYLGRNPNYPSVLRDKLPALEGVTSSEAIAENLTAMQSAWKAFVSAEASEKIRRASRHNVRVSDDTRCFTADSVFFRIYMKYIAALVQKNQ